MHRDELVAAHARIEVLERELEALREELREHESQDRRVRDQRLRRARDELRAQQEQYEQARAKKWAVEERVEELTRDNEALRAELEQQRQARRDDAVRREEFEAARARIQALEGQLEELRQKPARDRSRSERRIRELEEERRTQRRQYERLRETKWGLGRRVRELARQSEAPEVAPNGGSPAGESSRWKS